MNNYINSIIAVMILCQTAVMIAPENDSAVKSIRIICAAVTLLTLISPVRSLVLSVDNISVWLDRITSSDIVSDESDENKPAAAAIAEYISDRYGIEKMTLVIITDGDEGDEHIAEIDIYAKNCPYTTRVAIEAELSEGLEVPIYVLDEWSIADK